MSSTPGDETGSDSSSTTTTATSATFLGLHMSSVLMLAAILAITLHLVRQMHLSREYPPGPRGFPFLGYLYVLGSPDKRKLFAELRDQYGDIFSFNLGCRLVVVVNGFETMKQVFVQQGNSFLDRPQVFTFTHVGQGKGLVNSSGEVWKEHRKFTLNTLRSLGIGKSSFAEKVQEELAAFCKVLDNTESRDFDPGNAIQTAIANIICSIAFGTRFDYDDPMFVRFLQIFDENMSISGGTALLNFFPVFQHMPGDMFKSRRVLKNVEYVQSYLRTWLDNAKKRFDRENVNDFIDSYFKEMEEKNSNKTFSYDQLLKLVGDLLVGGTETTGTTLRWVIIFLVRWPHVQRKLRQEIDTVYPEKETPSVQDRRRMPYMEATILESQRFADIAPFSVTHTASEDVQVGGKVIPKGSIIIPNIHSVHHDPELWGDHDDFRPERFLDANGEIVRPDYLIPFFMGKRSCPGEGLARMELFQFIATILQRYEIRPAGKGSLPGLKGHVGITFTPFPYNVRFVRRDLPPPEEEEEGEGAEQAEESNKSDKK